MTGHFAVNCGAFNFLLMLTRPVYSQNCRVENDLLLRVVTLSTVLFTKIRYDIEPSLFFNFCGFAIFFTKNAH